MWQLSGKLLGVNVEITRPFKTMLVYEKYKCRCKAYFAQEKFDIFTANLFR